MPSQIERERGAFDSSIATLDSELEDEGLEDRVLQAEMLRNLADLARTWKTNEAPRVAGGSGVMRGRGARTRREKQRCSFSSS